MPALNIWRAFGDIVGPLDAGRVIGAGRLSAEFSIICRAASIVSGSFLILSIRTALQSASSSICLSCGAM